MNIKLYNHDMKKKKNLPAYLYGEYDLSQLRTDVGKLTDTL